MKIICGSCKKIVDTNKHDFCPKCGSNFNYYEGLSSQTRHEDYNEYERARQESNVRMAEAEAQAARDAHEAQHRANAEAAQREARKRASELETKRRRAAAGNKQEGKKNAGCGCFTVVMIIVIFGMGMLSEVDNADELFEAISDEFTSYVEEETEGYFDDYTYDEYEMPPAEVYTNEYNPDSYDSMAELYETAIGDTYSIYCDEIIPAEGTSAPPADGYVHLSFHLVLENTYDLNEATYYFAGATCYADGMECMPILLTDFEYFAPGLLDYGDVYGAYVTFDIPVDTDSVSLIYCDETEIRIDEIEVYIEDAAVYNDNYGEEYTEAPDEEYTDTADYIEGGMYDFIAADRYLVICDEIKEAEVVIAPPAEGNMYVSFGITVTNFYDETIYHFGYPECYADGAEAGFIAFSGDPLFMPGELEPFEEYSGYMCYEVPIDTETFEIIYHDEVKITIPNTLNEE